MLDLESMSGETWTQGFSMADTLPPEFIRFGTFELDLATADLHRNGRKTRLPEQQFRILEMLLRREGKLVSRWVTDGAPHPRKFYRLAKDGIGLHAAMTEAWVAFRKAMTAIVEDAS